jgi:hypothetical protein
VSPLVQTHGPEEVMSMPTPPTPPTDATVRLSRPWRADYTPAPPADRPLTAADLTALKRRWFAEGRDSGDLTLLGRLGRELGTPVPSRHPPKYLWDRDGVAVYVDGYDGYLTVHQGDRQVCSTHYCTQLFAPGPWLDVVRAAAPELDREAQARDTEREAVRRLTLRREPGLDR